MDCTGFHAVFFSIFIPSFEVLLHEGKIKQEKKTIVLQHEEPVAFSFLFSLKEK